MLYAIVVVLLLIADQGLKYWVTVHVPLDQAPHALIPKLLNITNTHNYGIAFSWFQNMPSWIFAVIAVLFSLVVILALKRGMIHGRFGRWMAVLALAGAIGNCIDRVLSGYVVDMLHFAFWQSFPVFNLADTCLVVGGIAFCLYVIFHKEPEEASAPKKPHRKTAAPKNAQKVSLGDKLAEKKAALQQSAEKRAEKREAERQRAAEAEKRAAAEAKAAAPAAKPAADDDPFAAWDRAVSEQDARTKAEEARKQAARAEREAKRKAEEAARAKAEEAKAAEPAPKPAPKAEPTVKKPAVDDAPTRKVAAQKIEEMAAKLAPKKPEPKPAPAPKAEEPVSYDLEDILNEFRDL